MIVQTYWFVSCFIMPIDVSKKAKYSWIRNQWIKGWRIKMESISKYNEFMENGIIRRFTRDIYLRFNNMGNSIQVNGINL